MNKDFAFKLKTLRQQKGITQQTVANYLNVARSTVSEYERGVIEPPPNKIKALSLLFGVTTDFLINESETKKIDIKKLIQDMIFNLQDSSKIINFNDNVLNETQKSVVLELLSNTLKLLELYNFN